MAKLNRRQNFINICIDKMFVLAGHKVSHQDFKRKNEYAHVNYTIKAYQQEEFENWFTSKVKSEGLATTDKEAQNELSWFLNTYQLKVVEEEFSKLETSTF